MTVFIDCPETTRVTPELKIEDLKLKIDGGTSVSLGQAGAGWALCDASWELPVMGCRFQEDFHRPSVPYCEERQSMKYKAR